MCVCVFFYSVNECMHVLCMVDVLSWLCFVPFGVVGSLFLFLLLLWHTRALSTESCGCLDEVKLLVGTAGTACWLAGFCCGVVGWGLVEVRTRRQRLAEAGHWGTWLKNGKNWGAGYVELVRRLMKVPVTYCGCLRRGHAMLRGCVALTLMTACSYLRFLGKRH